MGHSRLESTISINYYKPVKVDCTIIALYEHYQARQTLKSAIGTLNTIKHYKSTTQHYKSTTVDGMN